MRIPLFPPTLLPPTLKLSSGDHRPSGQVGLDGRGRFWEKGGMWPFSLQASQTCSFVFWSPCLYIPIFILLQFPATMMASSHDLPSSGIFFFTVLFLPNINSILPYCLLPLSSFHFSVYKIGFLFDLGLSLSQLHYHFHFWNIKKIPTSDNPASYGLIILKSNWIKLTLRESSFPSPPNLPHPSF